MEQMYPDPSEGPLRPDLAVILCEYCNGDGYAVTQRDINRPAMVAITCTHCHGTGECMDQECECGTDY